MRLFNAKEVRTILIERPNAKFIPLAFEAKAILSSGRKDVTPFPSVEVLQSLRIL